MLLIRYMRLDHGLSAIRDEELKLSRPLDVNDPYEMMGACVGHMSQKVRKEFYDNITYGWLKESLAPSGRGIIRPLDVVQREATNYSEAVIKRVIMERSVVQGKERFVCFSDPNRIDGCSDQLMWAHYADGGKGVRVWFDSDKFPVAHMVLRYVAYADRRPMLDLGKCECWMDDKIFTEFAVANLFTKSNAWEYEHEYRLLIGQKMDESLLTYHDSLEFLRIPRTSIIRIDFGPKQLQDVTRSKMNALRKDPTTSHIELRAAIFDGENYGYKYMPYEKFAEAK